ncbi:MAG: BA14K family protein [Rhodomicrobium sp.]
MLYKGFLFAAAAWTALSAAAPADAGPAALGLAPQSNDAAIVKVDYYYRGYDGYGEDPYPGPGLLGLPFAVLGGVAGIVGGILDAPFHGLEYQGEPYYGRYYDRDTYNGNYREPYYGRNYDRGAYNGYYREPYYGQDYNDSAYYTPKYYSDTRDDRDYGGDDTAYRSRYYGNTYYGSEGDDGTYYGGQYSAYAGAYEERGAAACAREFRSFDPASGTYSTYDGRQVVCPYLER